MVCMEIRTAKLSDELLAAHLLTRDLPIATEDDKQEDAGARQQSRRAELHPAIA